MGNGWFGNGWFGNGWFGNGWFGNGWMDGGDGGSSGVYAMRADQPLVDINVKPYNLNATFPDNAWDPDLVSLTIMPEFLAEKDASGKHWKEAVIAELPAPLPITEQMIDEMRLLVVTDRPEAAGEIAQEHANFQLRYLHLLGISRQSNPRTFLLMKIAARVGEFSMITLKRLKKPEAPWDLRWQPRPSQVCPTLFPLMPVPGHASYPAGHALIAWLTTECLKDIPKLSAPAYTNSLEAIADRVGRNRVIAGFHFPQDIEAGKKAGKKIHEFLKNCPFYRDTLAQAKQEWV